MLAHAAHALAQTVWRVTHGCDVLVTKTYLISVIFEQKHYTAFR